MPGCVRMYAYPVSSWPFGNGQCCCVLPAKSTAEVLHWTFVGEKKDNFKLSSEGQKLERTVDMKKVSFCGIEV